MSKAAQPGMYSIASAAHVHKGVGNRLITLLACHGQPHQCYAATAAWECALPVTTRIPGQSHFCEPSSRLLLVCLWPLLAAGLPWILAELPCVMQEWQGSHSVVLSPPD